MTKPCTEEAVPATWPSGSMASEPKFDATSPKQNITPACRMAKLTSVSWPVIDTSAWIAETAMKPISAMWETRRGPRRPTIRALSSDDSAMKPAMKAKTEVKSFGADSVSAKTCWAELMKPKSAPSTSVIASM